ncbi:MAG TPA: S53 family peptidase [Acidobacteriaceae bacterium]
MRAHTFTLSAAAAVLIGLSLPTVISAQSSKAAAAHPQVLGAADPSTSTHFSVFLPLTNQAALEQLVAQQTDSSSPNYHQWLTPGQFKAQFGPKASTVAAVKNKLKSAGFTITAEHTQSLEVEGSVSAVENLFNTRLQQVKTRNGHLRLDASKLTLPAELAAAGAVIPQFAPLSGTHVHSARLSAAPAVTKLTANSGGGMITNQRLSTAYAFYLPDDLNEAYVLPAFNSKAAPLFGSHKPVQMAGVGSHIGIVISSVISPTDILLSFDQGIEVGPIVDYQDYSQYSNLPVPSVTIRPVDGGSGPFNPASGDADEASLDTQMSLGTAPGAQETLYNIPDLSDGSIIDGYTAVVEDNSVDVVSSSFGGCELYYTAAYNGGVDYTSILKAYHSIFLQGNAQGITFLASSGDNGAVPCVSVAFANTGEPGTNFVPGVENPASDPAVTGVGGTNLITQATPTTNDSTYLVENANYDPRLPAEYEVGPNQFVTVGNNTWGSGGGYSSVFSRPAYQLLGNTEAQANKLGKGFQNARAVPDVSLQMGGCPGDADLAAQDCTALPRSAVVVWIGGGPYLLIGTSASSPEMAGVVAIAVEDAGTRLGNINPLIYALSAVQSLVSDKSDPHQYFHRNISGNNNFFTVSPNDSYSPVLGNGTLNVRNFLQLQGVQPAGTPNTVTNP